MPETFEIIDPLERFVRSKGGGSFCRCRNRDRESSPHKALWLAGAAMFAISTLILVNTLNPRMWGEFASGGQAFADCVPSPNTPASVIEYFQKLHEPLPERFCANEDGAPQASDESPTPEPPQDYENARWSRYAQRNPESAAQESAHAIVPDAPQVTAPTREVPTPQAGEPSAEAATPQATAPTTEVPTPEATAPTAELPTSPTTAPTTEVPTPAPTEPTPKPGNRLRKRLRLKAQRRVELLPWLHLKPVGWDLFIPPMTNPPP